MSLHRLNLAANLGARSLQVITTMIAVPVYANLLGGESYGLFSFITMMIGCLAFLDLGLPSLVNRLTANNDPSASGLSQQSYFILWIIGATIGIATYLAGPLIVQHWLNTSTLDRATITTAIQVMAIPLCLRFPIAVRTADLQAQRDHLPISLFNGGTAIMQQGGGILVLSLYKPNIEILTVWIAFVTIMQAVVLEVLWNRASRKESRPSFANQQLLLHFRFCAGITAASVAASFSLQADRLITSLVMPLMDFTHYSLAATAAGAACLALGPITATFFPILCNAFTKGETEDAFRSYRQLTWVSSLFLMPAMTSLAFFSQPLMSSVFSDPTIALAVANVCPILVLASLLGALAIIPYQIQVAQGTTRFVVQINFILLIFGAPLCWWCTIQWGARGTALATCILSGANLAWHVHSTHRRWFVGKAWSWMIADVLRPLLMSSGIALTWFLIWSVSDGENRIGIGACTISTLCGVLAIYALGRPPARMNGNGPDRG